MKERPLGEILTVEELRSCIDIWTTDHEHFHQRVIEEVIRPAMPRINATLEQENDERFIAYMVEFGLAFTQKRDPK